MNKVPKRVCPNALFISIDLMEILSRMSLELKVSLKNHLSPIFILYLLKMTDSKLCIAPNSCWIKCQKRGFFPNALFTSIDLMEVLSKMSFELKVSLKNHLSPIFILYLLKMTDSKLCIAPNSCWIKCKKKGFS